MPGNITQPNQPQVPQVPPHQPQAPQGGSVEQQLIVFLQEMEAQIQELTQRIDALEGSGQPPQQ